MPTTSLRSTPITPRFRVLMQDCAGMTLSHLGPLIRGMLEQAEVALLDAASKAEDNAKQSQYFGTMNMIKRSQQAIVDRYLKALEAGFDRFIQGELEEDTGGGLDGLRMQQLSLVDKQDVEYELPVRNLISKAGSTYAQALYGLDQRLAVVNGGERVPEEARPGCPHHLGHAFRDAIKPIEMERPVQLILFALYDRHVMRELSDYYEEYNRRLIERGILPNLRYEIRKHRDVRRSPGRAAGGGQPAGNAAGAAGPGAAAGVSPAPGQATTVNRAHGADSGLAGGPGEAEPELLADLRQGLARARGGEVVEQQLAPERREQSRRQLVHAAQALQEEHARETTTPAFEDLIANIRIDEDLMGGLQAMLASETRQIHESLAEEEVDPEDSDIIDLVGMLFEKMLQEPQLPNTVKALLSRLHTPYLKVGLLDKAFFMQPEHPARRLLDNMIDAGERWVIEDDLQRGIFPCMRHAVERILEDYGQDKGLFEELEGDVQAHIEELDHKTGLIEQRAVEAADGQERLRQARRRAHAELARVFSDRTVPEEAALHLTQVWSEKLMFIMLREPDGEQDPAWKLAVRVLQDILQSIEPADAAACEARQARLPDIRQAIKDALENLNQYGRKDNAALMQKIIDWQDQACDSQAEQPVSPISLEILDLTVDEEQSREGSNLSALEQTHADHLESVIPGVWFQFREPDGKTVKRLRLAWFTKLSKRYLFVDPMGVRAAEYHRDELARLLASDRARMIEKDNRPFVERTLDSLLNWLKG